ncbi:MAG: hypothetical protein ABID61_01470 [Candidatus Micrarchaeota archaeon]
MNIVIPLAGIDKNFEDRGTIKCLVDVNGKPLIQQISESRPFSFDQVIFILLRKHQKQHLIDTKLKELFGDKITIIWAEKETGGAPQSILLAEHLINNDKPLLIDLADQYLDLSGFMAKLKTIDGAIPTFESYYYNRGYMQYDKNGDVAYVSEKDKIPISTHSTACISYFTKGSDFVRAAKNMISKKKVAANGAYLVSLVYNELISEGKKILPITCEFIASLGNPDAIKVFPQIDRPLKCTREVLSATISTSPIISHRAICESNEQENSLAGIQTSIKNGFGVEIDVRQDKEGRLVLSHDELSKANKSLVTLDEAFVELSKRTIGVGAIHVKDKTAVSAICDRIVKHNLQRRVFVFGTEEDSIPVAEMVKSIRSDILVAIHISANSKLPSQKQLEVADILWVDEAVIGTLDQKIPHLAKELGIRTIATSPELNNLTSNNIEAYWRKLLDYGYDAICTDYPQRLAKIIKN